MKLINTKYGRVTATGLFYYLALFATWFYFGYERNADLRGTGGVVFLLILAAICSLVTWFLLFAAYEETIINQAEETERLSAKHLRDADAEKKWDRISRTQDELELILRDPETGPYGYSFAQLRQMAKMRGQGADTEDICKATGIDIDILRYLLAITRLTEPNSDYLNSVDQAVKEYGRLQKLAKESYSVELSKNF